jgi:hypothetical protein
MEASGGNYRVKRLSASFLQVIFGVIGKFVASSGYRLPTRAESRGTNRRKERMPKRHLHSDASQLAGEVFGKVLNRAADREGYAYVLDCLDGGKKSVGQIVLEFVASEFIDNFVAARGMGDAAKLVNKILPGRILSATELHLASRQLVRYGLRQYSEQIINSPEYMRRTGPDRMPGEGH